MLTSRHTPVPDPLLQAGQRQPVDCHVTSYADFATKKPINAAQAVTDDRASIAIKLEWIVLNGATFDPNESGHRSRSVDDLGSSFRERLRCKSCVRQFLFRSWHVLGMLFQVRKPKPFAWIALGATALVFLLTAAFSSL